MSQLLAYLFFDVLEGNRKGRGIEPSRKKMASRVFPDVNEIGRPKAVTSIPILLGHYGWIGQLQK